MDPPRGVPEPERTSLVLLALIVLGCGGRTEPLGSSSVDAATVDVPPPDTAPPDATPSRCATIRASRCTSWSFGEPRTLTFGRGVQTHIHGLAGDCTGAWMSLDARTPNAGQPITGVARVDSSGVQGPFRLWGSGPIQQTLAVDFVSGRAAAMGVGDFPSGYYSMRLDTPGFPADEPVAITTGMGFSLGGCHAGLAPPGGFSFLAEQVRALWGLERIRMEAGGTFRDRLVLLGESAEPWILDLYDRVGYDDGGYTLLWLSRAGNTRQAIYYDAAERPDGPRSLGAVGSGANVLGAVATVDGFVDAYRAGATDATVRFVFFDRTGRVRRREVTLPASFGAGLHGFTMAYTRGSLLSVMQAGSGAPLLELVALSDVDGSVSTRQYLRLTSPVVEARATAAGDGAIVVWTDATPLTHAVSLRCR